MKNTTTTLTTFVLSLCGICLFGQTTDKQAIVSKLDSLGLEAQKVVLQGDFAASQSMLDAADELALTHFGEASQEYARCIYARGSTYYLSDQYQDALVLLEKAEALAAKASDPMTVMRGKCANQRGLCYAALENPVAAEAAYHQSLEIMKHIYSEKSKEYLATKSNLLNLYTNLGRFQEAIELAAEILTTREELVGKMHPEYAANLNQLGIIYASIGRYEEAEPILIEASEIIAKTLGTDNTDYVNTIVNLAVIYLETGRYAESEVYSLKTKDLIAQLIGTQHPYYADVTNNLGVLYWKQHRYEEAADYYRQTLELREKIFGKEHLLYVGTQLNLGIVYLETGKLQEARPLIENARAIFEKTAGKQSLLYAECRGNEANLYMEMKRYDEAGPLYEEAISIFEQNKATQHPNFFIILDRYARWQFQTGRTGAGLDTKKRELKLLEESAAKAATFMSEQELSQYVRYFSEADDWVFSCLSGLPEYRNNLTPICYNNALFEKGFLQNAVGQMRRLAYRDAAATNLFNQLTGFRRQLAGQYSLPADERNNDFVAQLESEAEKTEKALVHSVAGYGQMVQQVAWQEVQAVLKSGEAAVEFVHFRQVFPNQTDQVRYGALVLHPGDPTPVYVPLFEEKSLNDLLGKRKSRRSDFVNDLYGGASAPLYDLVWKNLEAELKGIKTIYYSPAGLLYRLNLAAIPTGGPANESLADRHHFVQLGSTRQLVTSQQQATTKQSALIFGGVQYDPAADGTPTDTTNAILVSRSRGELDFGSTDSALRGGTWGYLKWTEKEAEAVRSTLSAAGFQPVLKTGYQATEEAFKAIEGASPQVIHLATHGYFFPDTKNRNEVQGMKNDEPVFKVSEQPMIRSGLVLAGGNHAWTTGKPLRPDLEDGILTAYEISQMDLSGAELVVLSACETGLGDIDGNEGVYGLQRAFKIAGAKYLIMSLWQVPDQQTQELMAALYDNWLAKKMSIPDAFRAAQQSVRERYEHPFFWAGFVLVE